MPTSRAGRVLGVVLLIALATVASLPLTAQSGAADGEWRYYGGDPGNTRYSPLDQINRTNVKDLRVAWRWKAANFGPQPDYNFQATPLMIGGVLYTTAGSRRVVAAIDAATGETLWMYRHDEGVRGLMAPNRAPSGRGVAYWTDGKADQRIVYATAGYQLVSLDPKTGRPIPRFGNNGVVDLYDDFDQAGRPKDGQLALTAVPTIIGDVVVVGTALQALSPSQEFVKGYVRAYDVRTGKRLWTFHTIPRPGEFGNETWENDSWSYTGNTGSWAGITADPELGYVYVPVETPTNDMYGGHRPGHGLFGESLVCLEAKTGKRVWHFQTVHHGIWDYDIPAPPILVDVTVDGKRIKAVAQVTKQAFTYVFDRVTGEPIWPIVERPVPQSDVPGEKTSPTQPFPTKPAPFDRQGTTLDDLIDFTPELRAEAIKIASQYKLGPLFTPPIVAGSGGKRAVLMAPSTIGGANWQGGAVDPETGILYVGSAGMPSAIAVTKDPKRSSMDYVGGGAGPAAGRGGAGGRPAGEVPAKIAGDGLGPQGLPLLKPPYGRITAIDLNSGEHVWMMPNADTPESIRNHPALKGVTLPRTGTPERSGILVTRTLMFAGEGGASFAVAAGWNGGGPMFRAYDKKTGEIVSELKLPSNQSGLPMTYLANGKQYIVVAVSTIGQAAELVALSLP
jgi:quinoprotein glucose dehydrogenase